MDPIEPINLDDVVPPKQWARPDYQLQSLVDLTDKGITGLAVTLLTGAGPVSGVIITYEEWARAIIDGLMDGIEEPEPNLRQTLEKYYFIGDDEPAPEVEIEDRGVIHLNNVTLSSGSAPIGTPAESVMRVRMTEVAGWMPGLIAVRRS